MVYFNVYVTNSDLKQNITLLNCIERNFYELQDMLE